MGRNSFLSYLFIFLFAFLAFAPAVAGPGMSTLSQLNAAGVGNGEVYAGGDFLERRLAMARDKLNQSISLLRSGFDVENLCGASCSATTEPSLCQTLRRLTAPQSETCRRFITDRLTEFEKLNSPKVIAFQLSQVPLVMQQGGRPVSAMTKPGTKDPVFFHYGSISNVSFEALIALITHELGHKIQLENHALILDDKPLLGFQSGREFLDAVGAALAIYSVQYSAPTQAPPPLPTDANLKQVCSLGSDSQAKFLIGMNFDVTGSMATAEMIQTWKTNIVSSGPGMTGNQKPLLTHAQQMLATKSAREWMVRSLFRKHLLRQPSVEETQMMVERIGAGVPHEAIVASLLGDEEYMKVRGAHGANQFVSTAFLDLLGRTPSLDETKTFMDQLGRLDRASVVLNVLKVEMGGWKKWVRDWYRSYYNRSPTESELSEHLARLRSGAGWESIQAILLSNPEYFTLQSARWPNCKGVNTSFASAIAQ